MAWSDPLPCWYRGHGRHDLPWRHTHDPWGILVSEIMLAQTPVTRVIGPWQRFMARWPDPKACAGAELDDILRLWQGLGYPRRARYLHDCARIVIASGWPSGEDGLRSLPGVGMYTARALLTFAWEAPAAPPREVNLGRVTARAALGVELHQAAARELDRTLAAARPDGMTPRHYSYALFDVGSAHCRARSPRCSTCPLATGCRSRDRLAAAAPIPPPGHRPEYQGSVRQLRGAILAAGLSDHPPRSVGELRRRVASVPATARAGALEAALDGLRRDGLITADRFVTRPSR